MPDPRQLKPVAPEAVPFTEYGDTQHATRRFIATSGWRMWAQLLLVLIALSAFGFVGLVLWKGGVVIGGMSFVNPFLSQDATQASDYLRSTPSPTPDVEVDTKLLQPLNLSGVSPKIVISQSDKTYLVDYDGENKVESTVPSYSGKLGQSYRCMFYIKENHQLFRSAIDGTQEQLVVELDSKLFEVPSDYAGHTGPGYGIEILGVDENCQQAVVNIHMNTATDIMPSEGGYLVMPEQKTGLILLDSAKEFIEFRNNKAWFVSHGIIYTVNDNGVFSTPFGLMSTLGYTADSFTNVDPDGFLVDISYLTPGEDNDIDPVSGQKVSSKISKVIEVNLKTSTVEAISTDSPTFYQHAMLSPDYTRISYMQETGEYLDHFPVTNLFVYNRENQQTSRLNLAKGFLGSVIWLNSEEIVVSNSTIAAGVISSSTLMKCSVVHNNCQALTNGELRAEFYY